MALSEAQKLAIDLLVEAKLKKKDIAKQCGVSNQSLSYWQRDDEFRRELLKAQRLHEEVVKTERIKKSRNILKKGLGELEKRLGDDKIEYEKTKDILAIIKEVGTLLRQDLGLDVQKIEKTEKHVHTVTPEVEEKMNGSEKFRRNIAGLLKGVS